MVLYPFSSCKNEKKGLTSKVVKFGQLDLNLNNCNLAWVNG
jgi:hypothetical protein